MDLFPFQKEGAVWLSGQKHALLADEMGLGKSAQAVIAADICGAENILVVCPAVAKENWRREFENWSLLETKAEIVSFDYATDNLQSLYRRYEWLDLLIIDECHFTKSLGAQRSKAVFGRNGLAHFAKRTWALSGTPAPNHVGELWILLFSYGVTRLSYDAFVTEYCETHLGVYGNQITGTKKEKIPEIREALSKIMLRRTKVQVMPEMPPIFLSSLVVSPGSVAIEPEDAEKLEEQEKLVFQALNQDEKLLMLEGLAGSVSTLLRYTGLKKVRPATALVSGELDAGLYDKIVIFCSHRRVAFQLKQELDKYNPVMVIGGSGMEERMNAVDAFQKDPKVKVFIGNILAAGTNLTLTASHQVLMVEESWVPGDNMQAVMRCHRIGQNKPVSVRFLTLGDGISERVTQVVLRKTKELAELFSQN